VYSKKNFNQAENKGGHVVNENKVTVKADDFLIMGEEVFALLCYLVRMQDIITKSPTHILEKKIMLDVGWDAFGFLDIFKKREVIKYLKTWGYKVDARVYERYEAEELKHTDP